MLNVKIISLRIRITQRAYTWTSNLPLSSFQGVSLKVIESWIKLEARRNWILKMEMEHRDQEGGNGEDGKVSVTQDENEEHNFLEITIYTLIISGNEVCRIPSCSLEIPFPLVEKSILIFFLFHIISCWSWETFVSFYIQYEIEMQNNISLDWTLRADFF